MSDGTILVRVAQEILDHLAEDGSGPVLLIGAEKQGGDRSYELTFKRVDLDAAVERAYMMLGQETLNAKPPILIGFVTEEMRDELRRITRAVLEAALTPPTKEQS
jgi:hypothetical protein